jgi:hypothetical protein
MGMTEAMPLAHGLTVETLVDLIRAGLVTAKAERVMAGGRRLPHLLALRDGRHFDGRPSL